MYIHEMIRETNRLRQQMTPVSEAYFSEMVLQIRSSSLNEAQGEEALLDIARRILKLQERNKPVQEVFGDHPQDYCDELVSDLNMRKPRTAKDKVKYYIMIPWVALTWVFFIYMIMGFLGKWFGGDLEYMRIRTSTLLLIALGSILLIELLTRFMGPDKKESDDEPKPHRIDAKSLGISVAVTAAIVAVYLVLSRLLPSFTVSPWDSLILFVIGLAGQQLIFLRKPRHK
ncbi:DUF1129 family protein [Paenibacillus caui]|uniref:DUF1129 family protein n=1 Tax=Paenibacillus caui TaxID=2873927 RepID=UPI001CA9551C|nr:DUF1129 family protein [Paenibacillus caui]